MSDNELKEVEFDTVKDGSAPTGSSSSTPQGMPSKGSYTALLVVGFVCGILWGLLSIGPYSKMNAAIAAGDSQAAWENAKKVKTFALIGIILNVVLILFRCMAGGY